MEPTTTQAYASISRRGLAYVIDALALGFLAAILASQRSDGGTPRLSLTAAIAGGLGTVYHVLLEGYSGRTLGKRLVGIAVVDDDGSQCTYRGAGIRTGFRAVDWLPVGYLLGGISIVRSSHNQRVGDRAAGTVVVRTDVGEERRTGTAEDDRVEQSASGGVVQR